MAPKLVGQGRDMANFGPLADLGEAVAFEFLSSEMIGPDLRLIARIPGRDRF
jgi:diaminohydroxyphosphoribosylaminopyrimidine deaminase/5-amino-6-(5-phosphoribosylamino)uracil reductase